MNKLYLLFILSFLTSCSSDKLVREDIEDYDLNKYLIGVGVAKNEENAKQRARSNLAKIFEVEIKEDASDETRFSTMGSNKNKVVNKSWQVSRNISTYTNKVLTGVQIASVKKDDELKTFKAVAILPRSQAATILKSQISNLDWDINKNLLKARSASSELNSIRYLYRALSSQSKREILQKALVVVDITGRGLKSDFSSLKIKQSIQSVLKSLKFQVDVSKSEVSGLKKIISSAIVNIGAQINQPEKYKVLGFAQLHDLGMQQGWYWEKVLISLKITNLKGQVLAGKNLSIKVAGIDKGSAKIKLEEKLLSNIEKLILKMILGKE